MESALETDKEAFNPLLGVGVLDKPAETYLIYELGLDV